MRNFNIAADIGAPPSRVWDVMVDVERWHEWTQSITSIKRKDSGPFSSNSDGDILALNGSLQRIISLLTTSIGVSV